MLPSPTYTTTKLLAHHGFANATKHLIDKIARASGCHVYLRPLDEDTDWCMACADEETEFGFRGRATAEGASPIVALDNLAARLGLVADEDGRLELAA